MPNDQVTVGRELLPCPFCGEPASAPKSRRESTDPRDGYVAFMACYGGIVHKLVMLEAHKAEVARLRGVVKDAGVLYSMRMQEFSEGYPAPWQQERENLRTQLDRANALLRSISPHIARAPEVGYLLGVIDAHLSQQSTP